MFQKSKKRCPDRLHHHGLRSWKTFRLEQAHGFVPAVYKRQELGEFAEKTGVRRVNGAMAQVARFAKHKFPGLPHILLGHSMGSFFGRRFITHYGEWLDGAIFMGTGSQPEPLLWLGGTVVAVAAWLEGRNGRNERLHQLVLGSYNHYFETGKTEHQWLSRVTEEDETYEADPYCPVSYTPLLMPS